MIRKSLFSAALVAVSALGSLGTAQANSVALELSLVIDVSGSVSTAEYDLQMNGYAAAFNNAGIQSAILALAGSGGIAVNVIQFATNAVQVVGWTQLTTAAQISAFATQMDTLARESTTSVGSGTDVEDGMRVGRLSFANNGFTGTRLVMDVSGDGIQNTDPACSGTPASDCAAVQAERDLAAAAGIKINGLAIEGDYGVGGLTTWYNRNVRTGDGFVVTADSFDDFERAVTDKIGREIVGTPEPGTLALLGLGLVGLGLSRRRKVA